MAKQIPVTNRASQIEYAIRDVVVPASALEAKGHNILKLNIAKFTISKNSRPYIFERRCLSF